MKRQFLLTRLLLLFALIVGSGSAWGAEPDLSSMVWSTPIVNENFNSCSAAMASAKKNPGVTNYSSMGEFNCVYNNNTSNKYGIENNTTFESNALKLSAGSNSPVISAISGKSFATKGAYSFKITTASKCYIGLFNETISGTAHAKAKATAYLQQNAGTLSICDGNGWVSVGSFTSTDVLEICVIYNSTASATSYGNNVSLAAKKAHIYVNGACVMDGENPKSFTIPGVAALGFRVSPLATSSNVAIVDDVKIYDALPTGGGGDPVPATGVSVKSETTLTVGDTEQLTAAVTPNNATDQVVSWESNNPSVATVDAEGNVSAVGLGTARITVTTHDGGYTANCDVTVVPVAATLDFSSNTDWGFPTDKTVGPKSYTNGYTVTLQGSTGNGYYFDTNNVLLGKNGATLTLPAFPFKVSKIKVYGTSGASASVTCQHFCW